MDDAASASRFQRLADDPRSRRRTQVPDAWLEPHRDVDGVSSGELRPPQVRHAGTIEPGMRADLAVLDRNPFDGPANEIATTCVTMTLAAGRVVYDGT